MKGGWKGPVRHYYGLRNQAMCRALIGRGQHFVVGGVVSGQSETGTPIYILLLCNYLLFMITYLFTSTDAHMRALCLTRAELYV